MPSSTEVEGGGVGAVEIVQTTLDHFGEPAIAGKTHSEILAMSKYQRSYYWYRKISPEEKAEAMQIVECERRRKVGEKSRQRIHSEETRRKRSQSIKRLWEEGFYDNPEIRLNMSQSQKKRFAEHPLLLGWKHSDSARKQMSDSAKKRFTDIEERLRQSERTKQYMANPEVRKKISEATTRLWQDPDYREKVSKSHMGHNPSDETRKKMSESQTGRIQSEEHKRKNSKSAKERYRTPENHPSWQGGKSFEPYCPKFNDKIKEKIRNRDNRICVLCGKPEILNGQRLSVHHITGNKMMGCNGIPWYLCALCHSCNSKPDTVEKEFLIVTGGRSVQ